MKVSRPRHADNEAGEERHKRHKRRRTIETPISFTPLIEKERMHTENESGLTKYSVAAAETTTTPVSTVSTYVFCTSSPYIFMDRNSLSTSISFLC